MAQVIKLLCSGILLVFAMTVSEVDLPAGETGKVLPSVAKRNVSRELNAYVERFSKDKKRDKNEINAKWVELARKHVGTVQTEGLSKTERKHLAELYAWAKMSDEAIAAYTEFAAGSDMEARKAARMILDIQIDSASKSPKELRAALNAYRKRFPHDIRDMLGLFSQIYRLANMANNAGIPDFAISIIRDEIDSLSLDHPYYNWGLVVESLKFYKSAGKLEEGLSRLQEYKAKIEKVAAERKANRPEDKRAAKKYDSITIRFEKLAESMKNAYIRETLIGQEAPGFNFTHFFNTDPIDYASLRGKVVVIDFWATWCWPCLKTFPGMRKFYAEYKDRGVQVIGVTGFQGRMSNHGRKSAANISRKKELALMKKFIKYQKVTWPIAFSDRNCYDPEYGIDAIPRLIVIDKKGILRLLVHTARQEEIIAKVKELLAEN